MARPERYNVDYFPHYIGDGKKIFYIEQKYGNDGYSTWFKILETLAKTDHHYIDLRKKTELMFLAAKCRITEETLINILSDLSNFEKIDSDLWAFKIVYSTEFITSIEDAYGKRKNKTLPKTELMTTLMGFTVTETGFTEKKSTHNTQSKVKERKVNKSKVEETTHEVIVYPSFDDFWNAYDKKVERAETEKKWLKLTQAEKEKIMIHVARYVVATPNQQYRKNPTTYLNQKTYLDEIVIPQQNGNASTKTTAADRHRESVIKAVNEINAGIDIPRADDIFRLPPPVKNSQ